MARYPYLLLDLDNTLLDFNADMTHAFERLYRTCGFEKQRPYSTELLDLYEEYNDRWWKKFERKECTKQELYIGRFVDFLKETGLSGDPEKINTLYFEFLGSGGTMLPGAEEFLEALKADHQLYIITNGNAVAARTRILNSGVFRYIENYFVSEAVGFAKPDVRYFQYVAEHIPGFEKKKALVIGDSLTSDIQGAKNFGLTSLWYHPREEANIPPIWDLEAKTYEKILELL